jgi:hypothetical protein
MRTETQATLGCSTALVHVQVRPTNCGRCHFDKTIIWMLELWQRTFLDGYLEGFCVALLVLALTRLLHLPMKGCGEWDGEAP